MLRNCTIAVAFAFASMLAPATASADWLFTPNIGGTFGGAASGNEHVSWGASIGWMGAGILGWEADFAYTPEFFEPKDSDLDLIDDSNATSVMGNVLIGIPLGGQRGGGFRPYAVGGVGLLKQKVTGTDDLFKVDNNDFGFDLGFGALAFFSDHVGIRGDVRYYRSFTENHDDSSINFDLGDFDFWRGTGGVTFRW